METEQPVQQKSSSKGIIITIIVIILVLGIAIIYKISHRSTKLANYYQNQAAPTYTQPTTPLSASPTPSIAALKNSETTNTQLDQDAQDIQNNLNKLDGNVTDVNQGFSNASNDTPQ